MSCLSLMIKATCSFHKEIQRPHLGHCMKISIVFLNLRKVRFHELCTCSLSMLQPMLQSPDICGQDINSNSRHHTGLRCRSAEALKASVLCETEEIYHGRGYNDHTRSEMS